MEVGIFPIEHTNKEMDQVFSLSSVRLHNTYGIMLVHLQKLTFARFPMAEQPPIISSLLEANQAFAIKRTSCQHAFRFLTAHICNSVGHQCGESFEGLHKNYLLAAGLANVSAKELGILL